ncbi:InlB B-repeat-containing protein [Clostridium sp.]|uniref:InlB B-repeat-containing protein n=1 Tax=Clostridium sp. TaxID=1506 RepID=UPI00283E09A6|nr:InlB B-repeat-containing protein [Clostridium sp.]MDR3595423.1 InlB B-repeat-containing protein [Clostridium sp.]
MRSKYISKALAGTVILSMMGTLFPTMASAEWEKDSQGNLYYTQDNQKLTGWKRIDGQVYYFDDNGKMQTGWIQAENSWYFLQVNGVLGTGWVKYNGNTYYTDSSGVMQTGVINIAGKIYIFDNNGVMKTSDTISDGQFYTIGLDGEVVGSTLPTPDKEFDASGKCINVLNNTESDVVASPVSSKFDTIIEDQSDSGNDDIEYVVQYKDTDGENLKTKTVMDGESIDLYEPTKDGYGFVEWNTRSDDSGTSYDEGDSVNINKNLTLYAQWTLDVDSISIIGSSTVAVNSTTQMAVSVSPSNAGNTAVTWSVTSGTGNATIDSSSGLLTGVTIGTVTVKATAKDGSGVSGTKVVAVG